MTQTVKRLCDALGNRLEKPGKERLTWTGRAVWEQAGSRREALVTVAWQYPGLLRVEQQEGAVTEIIGFDGTAAWRASGPLRPADIALIEMLLYDTPEHFFISQDTSTALFLSSSYTNIKKDKQGKLEKSNSLVFGLRGATGSPRYYYFGDTSLLLDTIRYSPPGAGRTEMVEVQIQNWVKIQGETLVSRMSKTFDDETLSLVLEQATVGPAGDTGVFRKGQ